MSKYDRTLYMCIVGAINNLPKENQENRHNQQPSIPESHKNYETPEKLSVRQPRNTSYRENK